MEEVKLSAAERMKKHVTVVGAVRIGFSALGLFVSLGMYFLFSHIIDVIPTEEMPTFVHNFLTYLFMVLPVVFGIISILGLIGGIALLSYKGWARIMVIIISALGCLNIPIGTLVGVYSIWVLMQDETIKLFEKPQ
jgi:hypothetical protein